MGKIFRQLASLACVLCLPLAALATQKVTMNYHFNAEKEVGDIANPSEMMLAIIHADKAALRRALKAKEPLNEASAEGVYPLMLAATYGDVETLKMLIAGDIDLSLRDAKGRNIMHYLAMRGAVNHMKLALTMKPKLALQADKAGWTPLFIAYANQHYQTADFLLNNRYDNVNRLNDSGVPIVFHFVKEMEAPEAVKHMISHKLNVFKRNKKDMTLHEVAAAAGHVQSAKLLEKRYEEVILQYQQRLKRGK